MKKRYIFILLLLLLSFTKLIRANCDISINTFDIELSYLDSDYVSSLENAFLTLEQKLRYDNNTTLISEEELYDKVKNTYDFYMFIELYEYDYSIESFRKYLIFLEKVKFTGKELAERQEKDMLELLATHGINTNSPKKMLTRVSLMNKNRLLQQVISKDLVLNEVLGSHQLTFDEMSRKLENNFTKETKNKFVDNVEKLRSLKFSFVHNTNISSNKMDNKLPIFSSRVLEELALGTGLNSDLSFTSKFLKSDNFVFFLAIPSLDGMGYTFRGKKYGKYSYSLNNDYARQNGVISIDLMYPYLEFKSFAELLPTRGKNFSELCR